MNQLNINVTALNLLHTLWRASGGGGGIPLSRRVVNEHSQLRESQKERKEKVTWASGRSRRFARGDVSWSSTQENEGSRGFSSASRANNKKEPRCLETILVASGLPDGGMMKRAETAG